MKKHTLCYFIFHSKVFFIIIIAIFIICKIKSNSNKGDEIIVEGVNIYPGFSYVSLSSIE